MAEEQPMEKPLYLVDAFSSQPFGGNPHDDRTVFREPQDYGQGQRAFTEDRYGPYGAAE